MSQNEAQKTPQQHAQRIAQMLQQAQYECRADIERVSDPKAQALFETIAEVLGGAMKALRDYQNGSERVWQSQQQPGTQAFPHQRTQPPVRTDLAVDVSEGEPPRLYTEMPHHPETPQP
jgi:hypothetical protein